MADTDPKVRDAVATALKKNPDATVDELFTVAKKVNKSVAKLSKRQFHARYPLQIKRKMNPPKPKRAKKAAASRRKTKTVAVAPSSARDAVRTSLLEFASDLAAATERKDAVRVVAGVDRYVDEVLKAVGGA